MSASALASASTSALQSFWVFKYAVIQCCLWNIVICLNYLSFHTCFKSHYIQSHDINVHVHSNAYFIHFYHRINFNDFSNQLDEFMQMFVFVFVRPIRQKFLAFAIKLPDFNNLLVKYLCIKLESTWLNNGITLDKHWQRHSFKGLLCSHGSYYVRNVKSHWQTHFLKRVTVDRQLNSFLYIYAI